MADKGLEALRRLKEGNKRFVEETVAPQARPRLHEPATLAQGQSPFAIVLACSDSRVPVEIVFDQGLGDLFVIRVAGHVPGPPVIGSIEFAAQQFGSPLLVVLGHSNCGAVQATLDHVEQPANDASPHLMSVVNAILPAVRPLIAAEPPLKRDALIDEAVRNNVREAATAVCAESSVITRLVNEGNLLVVGAEYCLETGNVDVFHGDPEGD